MLALSLGVPNDRCARDTDHLRITVGCSHAYVMQPIDEHGDTHILPSLLATTAKNCGLFRHRPRELEFRCAVDLILYRLQLDVFARDAIRITN